MNSNTDNGYFECFAFGDSPEMADELWALVLAGKKTATVSVVLENERTPGIGDLSLVLDGQGNPACVIKTVHLEAVRFCDLTWDMVKLEGEDDTPGKYQHREIQNTCNNPGHFRIWGYAAYIIPILNMETIIKR